jgi:hypothetical protein
MVKNINVKLANMIKEYIFSVPFLKSKISHYNIKYSIGELIDNIIIIFKTGISYRDIVSFRNIYIRTNSYYTPFRLYRYNIYL